MFHVLPSDTSQLHHHPPPPSQILTQVLQRVTCSSLSHSLSWKGKTGVAVTTIYHQLVTVQGLESTETQEKTTITHQSKGGDLRGDCLVLSQPIASCIKRKPLFPVLPISAMAQDCLQLPAFSSTTSTSAWCQGRQQVTKTHDLPKRQSVWDCQIQLQTGSCTPECSSSTSNHLVGFCGESAVVFKLCL